MWSMGAVLFTMVSGIFPFETPAHENNLTMTLQNLKAGRYQALPAGTSAELADLIGRTFQPDPAKRITLAGLACHRWLTDFEEVKTLPAPPGGGAGSFFRGASASVAAGKPTTPPERQPQPAHASKRSKAAGGGALAQQLGGMRIAEEPEPEQTAPAAAPNAGGSFSWGKWAGNTRWGR